MDPVVGRTGWDALHDSRKGIVQMLVLAGIGIGLYLAWPYLEGQAVQAIVIGAVVGWLLAGRLTPREGRLILVVSAEDHQARMVYIPEELYRTYTQCGNAFCFTSVSGLPMYFAQSINTETKIIDYGWIHEYGLPEVLSDISTYDRWYDRYCTLEIENVRLKDRPHVMAADMVQRAVGTVIDDYDQALRLVERRDDFVAFEDPVDPRPGEDDE